MIFVRFVDWRSFWIIVCILSLGIVVTISAMPMNVVCCGSGSTCRHAIDHTVHKIVYIVIFILVGFPI